MESDLESRECAPLPRLHLSHFRLSTCAEEAGARCREKSVLLRCILPQLSGSRVCLRSGRTVDVRLLHTAAFSVPFVDVLVSERMWGDCRVSGREREHGSWAVKLG